MTLREQMNTALNEHCQTNGIALKGSQLEFVAGLMDLCEKQPHLLAFIASPRTGTTFALDTLCMAMRPLNGKPPFVFKKNEFLSDDLRDKIMAQSI